MSIETITVPSQDLVTIDAYRAFGWQITKEEFVRSGRGRRKVTTLARSNEMLHYNELHQLEISYFEYKKRLKTYQPGEFFLYLVLYALFFVPGILYSIYKINQKMAIKEHNNELQRQMKNILNQAIKVQKI